MVRHSYASCSDFSFWSGSPDPPEAADSLMAQNGNSGVTTEAMRCSALISSVGLSSSLFPPFLLPGQAQVTRLGRLHVRYGVLAQQQSLRDQPLCRSLDLFHIAAVSF